MSEQVNNTIKCVPNHFNLFRVQAVVRKCTKPTFFSSLENEMCHLATKTCEFVVTEEILLCAVLVGLRQTSHV